MARGWSAVRCDMSVFPLGGAVRADMAGARGQGHGDRSKVLKAARRVRPRAAGFAGGAAAEAGGDGCIEEWAPGEGAEHRVQRRRPVRRSGFRCGLRRARRRGRATVSNNQYD